MQSAARPPGPGLIEMPRHADVSAWNAAATALTPLAVDNEVSVCFGRFLNGGGGFARAPIICLLGAVQRGQRSNEESAGTGFERFRCIRAASACFGNQSVGLRTNC
jgi:hypothetical protein